MNKIIKITIIIGLVIALIVFGYIAGYQIGSAIDQDITQRPIEKDTLTFQKIYDIMLFMIGG